MTFAVRSDLALEPIAQGTCDHRHAEPRYVPSRKLKHLIRARAQACTAPGCGGQSTCADQDHVVPYPDGPTCECNLHAPCRAHQGEAVTGMARGTTGTRHHPLDARR